MATPIDFEVMDMSTMAAHFQAELDQAHVDLKQLSQNWEDRVRRLALCDENTTFLYDYAQKYYVKQCQLVDATPLLTKNPTLQHRQRIVIGKPTLMHPTIDTLIMEVMTATDLASNPKVWVKPLYRLVLNEDGTILHMTKLNVDESLQPT